MAMPSLANPYKSTGQSAYVTHFHIPAPKAPQSPYVIGQVCQPELTGSSIQSITSQTETAQRDSKRRARPHEGRYDSSDIRDQRATFIIAQHASRYAPSGRV
jgi:hypothetical protein